MDNATIAQAVDMMNPKEQVAVVQSTRNVDPKVVKDALREQENQEVAYYTSELAKRDGGKWEGFETTGYVPSVYNKDTKARTFGKSGVTAGVGVDLGQMSKSDIKALGLDEKLTNRLLPYAGLKGKAAFDFLQKNPLVLSEDEAAFISQPVVRKTIKSAKKLMDKSGTSDNWSQMTDTEKFVAIAAQHQYGDTNLVRQYGKGDFQGALDNLASWTDKTPEMGDLIASKYKSTVNTIKQERGLDQSRE